MDNWWFIESTYRKKLSIVIAEENITQIENEIELLEEQQKEMLVIIQSFKGVENEIVRMKYIEGLTLEEIVEETGYSDSYIRKKHAEIRSKLQFIDDYEARHLDRKAKKEELEYYDEKRRKTQQLSLFWKFQHSLNVHSFCVWKYWNRHDILLA